MVIFWKHFSIQSTMGQSTKPVKLERILEFRASYQFRYASFTSDNKVVWKFEKAVGLYHWQEIVFNYFIYYVDVEYTKDIPG